MRTWHESCEVPDAVGSLRSAGRETATETARVQESGPGRSAAGREPPIHLRSLSRPSSRRPLRIRPQTRFRAVAATRTRLPDRRIRDYSAQ